MLGAIGVLFLKWALLAVVSSGPFLSKDCVAGNRALDLHSEHVGLEATKRSGSQSVRLQATLRIQLARYRYLVSMIAASRSIVRLHKSWVVSKFS